MRYKFTNIGIGLKILNSENQHHDIQHDDIRHINE
jgi:hypothetical protein